MLVKTYNGAATVKKSLAVPQKLNTDLAYDNHDLAISLPGIYSKEMKTQVHT